MRDGIIGLENTYLFCYMNTCLQIIFAIAEMKNYYIRGEYKRFKDQKTVSNSQSFSNMLSQMYEKVFACESSERRVLPFANSYKDMFSKNFDPLYQHDGHMFLMYLFDQLQAEETPVNK